MNDDQIADMLGSAQGDIINSENSKDALIASSYALRSIASILFIIAERIVNLPRDKKDE